MSQIKKWSTGSIGNEYSSHEERGNDNSKGLDETGLPGVEAYIEEDDVDAKNDNRPLKNLVANDTILAQNASDVASEVDYGVFANKYDQYELTIQPDDFNTNPETGNKEFMNSIRVSSGSSIVDGQVTRIGNQQLIYFYRADDFNSILFPPYDENEDATQIEIYDDDYFNDSGDFGEYIPVYSTLAEDLPSDFENYEIIIINRDSTDPNNSNKTNISVFDTYRDWEDIVPYKAESETVTKEIIDFQSDLNYGQRSDGYWLDCGGVKNTRVSEIQIEKDIDITDKEIMFDDFNGKDYSIVTDGLFFKDLKWSSHVDFDVNGDIQDLYVNDSGDVYFIQRSQTANKLFRLLNNSIQLETKELRESSDTEEIKDSYNLGLTLVDHYLIINGTAGYLRCIDLNEIFQTSYIDIPLATTQDLSKVYVWDNRVWVAGEKSIFHTPLEGFDPATAVFEEIDFDAQVKNVYGDDIVKKIKTLTSVRGNYYNESSLLNGIKENYLENSSFEVGGVGNAPLHWMIEEDGSGSTLEIDSYGSVDAKAGNYYVKMNKGVASTYCSMYQDVTREDALSGVALLSNVKFEADTVLGDIRIIQMDSEGATLATETMDLNDYVDMGGTPGDYLLEVANLEEGTKTIRVSISIRDDNELTMDLAALTVYDSESDYQWADTYEFLFIGFEKLITDQSNQPFAFIDASSPYDIKYSQNLYGEIAQVNDAVSVGSNQMYFVSDKDVYKMNLMNNTNEYDRFSISSIFKNDEDFYVRDRIKKYETINIFNDKLFYGGVVGNEVVRVEAINDEVGDIIIEDSGIGESLLTLMGGTTNFSSGDRNFKGFQFNRIEKMHQAPSGSAVTEEGVYIPNVDYTIKVTVDGVENILVAHSPIDNTPSWTPTQVRNQLNTYFNSSIAPEDRASLKFVECAETTYYDEWVSYSSSIVERDGLYDNNGNNETTLIRGNIHKIFISDDSSEFYIAKDDSIFKTEFDSNKIKDSDGNYQDALWDIHNENYKIDEYLTESNILTEFNDDGKNRHLIDIPNMEGYKLVEGSLRIKVSESTEVGYAENEDYFVDYDNAKIIRSTNTNYTKNTNFSLVAEDDILNWDFYSDNPNSIYSREVEGSKHTEYTVKFYKDPDAINSVFYQTLTSVDVENNPNFVVGSTYNFSVYLKSPAPITGSIGIVECDDSNVSNFDMTSFDGTDYTIKEVVFDELNGWTRVDVAHTIAKASSTSIRLEMHNPNNVFVLASNPQLEKNNYATPFISGSKTSRIDPDMRIYLDFIKYKTLEEGVGVGQGYTFDAANRSFTLTENPKENASYFLSYKYTKIFNPYYYPDTKPSTTIIDYGDYEDFFLFELEGKIWAINQNFAMLSLDDANPLYVSYKYHYPRIDVLKIRNTPDQYGNYLYFVKGKVSPNNPYKPLDSGQSSKRHVDYVEYGTITDFDDIDQYNGVDNDVLYEINVSTDTYAKNDVYDRRIYVDTKYNTSFNISLYPETVAYFPFLKDFNSTNGLRPLNLIKYSKIVPIIKNYNIIQNEEIGAWHDGYQTVLRNNQNMSFPATSFSIFVDPIYGDDTRDGEAAGRAVQTVAKAVDLLTEVRSNIVVINESSIKENVEIDKDFHVKIFAQTYCYWQGGIQNLSNISIQGIWFQNTNIYPYAKINFYYSTFENTANNCVFPQNLIFNNCEFDSCHNPIIRVKDTLFPSPFTHPYEKFPLRDDGIVETVKGIATSDYESIAPGDSYYNSGLLDQPSGDYIFKRCLIHDSTDSLVKYDPDPEWISSFYFSYCTIANNGNLFETKKQNLSIDIENSIIANNGYLVNGEKKIFSTNSDISFYNSFIDMQDSVDDVIYNDGDGLLLNRESCVGRDDNADPGFIGEDVNGYNYYLKSISRGSSFDSICLDGAVSGDLGCYDETREQKAKNTPKKLRSYVAFIQEGIVYPIQLNSEKITMTMEFKPTNTVTQPGIVFDTREASDVEDYIVLAYNNNDDDDHSLTQNPTNSLDNPYRFRLIVANKETSYSIISPVEIYTDEDYQVWHTLSFTVNYEEIINSKSTFSEKDTRQNIITLYHNDSVSVESFVKYDLSTSIDGEEITDRNGEGTNAWNYNDLCKFITLGSDYRNENKINGYYSELRVDNRFIDRKQFELWNNKEVPFNDPMSYVDQAPLTRSIDNSIINEYWSLKSESEAGAKGNKFNDGSAKRTTKVDGETAWALVQPTNNLMDRGGFSTLKNAEITGDTIEYPVTISSVINISTVGSRNTTDNTGYDLDLRDVNHPNYTAASTSIVASSESDLIGYFENAFSKVENTHISYQIEDGRLRLFTKDYGEVTLNIDFDSSMADLGFSEQVVSGSAIAGLYTVNGLDTTNTHTNNVYYDDDDTIVSNGAVVLERADGLTDAIDYKQQRTLDSFSDYSFSAYAKCSELLNNDTFKFYMNGDRYEWDEIDKYSNGWMTCKKRFTTDDSGAFDLGVSAIGAGDFVISGLQLEKSYFVSPFVENFTSDSGALIVDKSLVDKDSGIMYMKFKPMFDFYDTTERYLLEMLEDGKEDQENLFRISYKYDEELARGIVKYNINNICTWDLEIVPTYWDQWHSLAIIYDFNINRYIFRFDFFSTTIDESMDNDFDFSDLYIGHGVSGISGRSTEEVTSDFYVKNLMIGNYPVTDNEMQNWVSSNEFFNESAVVNMIEDYQDKINTSIQNAENIISISDNLTSEMQTLREEVNAVQSEYSNVTDSISTINNSVYSIKSDIDTLEAKSTSLDAQINGDDGTEETMSYMRDGNTGSWSKSIDGANIYDLHQNMTNNQINIASEINDRISEDNQIRSDFASVATGSGASLVSVASNTPASPLDASFTNSNLDSVVREIAGSGRTVETVKGNSDSIDLINANIDSVELTDGLMQDGGAGTWTSVLAQNDGWNIADLRVDASANTVSITALQQEATSLRTDLTNEISSRAAGDNEIRSDLASVEDGEGAALIGMNDAENLFVANNVHDILVELAGLNRNEVMTVADNYERLNTHDVEILANNTLGTSNAGAIVDTNTQVNLMKDGDTGTTWTDPTWNLVEHEGRIDAAEAQITLNTSTINGNIAAIGVLQTGQNNLIDDLDTEAINRTNADALIRLDLASVENGKGASLIGVEDTADNFIADKLEAILVELNDKIGALAGALAWQAKVDTYTDLPITDNKVGDARTVENNGDDPNETSGGQAQYVCVATTGTREEQWIKIADIDWGYASGIAFDPSTTELTATSVQGAIEEVYSSSLDPAKSENEIALADWTAEGDSYVINIEHGLKTMDIVAQAIDLDTGMMIGLEDIERVDADNAKVYVSEPLNMDLTFFGVVDNHSIVIADWVPDGDRFYKDINHGWETKKVMTSVFDMTTNKKIGVEDIEFVDMNTIRVWSDISTNPMNVYMTKKIHSSNMKDIESWTMLNGMYYADIKPGYGMDAIYNFFDPTTGMTVGVDEVEIYNGYVRVVKSDNSRLRVVAVR